MSQNVGNQIPSGVSSLSKTKKNGYLIYRAISSCLTENWLSIHYKLQGVTAVILEVTGCMNGEGQSNTLCVKNEL